MAGRGWNPIHGADNGPPPPGTGYSTFPQTALPPGLTSYVPFYQQPAQQVYSRFYQAQPQHQVSMYQPHLGEYSNPGFALPSGVPPNDIPGVHFRNPSGGVGLPPGYDYLFPSEHCTVHAFKCGPTPPWQTSNTIFSWDQSKFVKCFVPVNTTVKELMQRLGCNNSDAKKNVVNEVVEKGNGQWAKGLTINGGDKDRCKKAIKDFGWDKSRTGFPGERPVVWLYLTKD